MGKYCCFLQLQNPTKATRIESIQLKEELAQLIDMSHI